MKKKKKISNYLIAIVIGLAFYGTLAAVWNFLQSPSPTKKSAAILVDRDPDICSSLVYDNSGKGHLRITYNRIDYAGKAPLFKLTPTIIATKKTSSECYHYPAQIDPTIAKTGNPIYPAQLIVNLNKQKITSGEAFEIEAKVEILDEFTDETMAVEFGEEQKIFLEFHLDAPNFEFSPSEEKIIPVAMLPNYPATQFWIVAPKDIADGYQIITIRIDGDRFYAKKNIEFEVRKILGINSSTLALVTLISAAIGQLLQYIKDSIDIWKTKKERK